MMNLDMSHANPELLAALAKAQGEIENATKGSVNPHFKSKYADLAEVLNTIRPVFANYGLSQIQSTGFDGSRVTVDMAICHAAGGYVTAQASCVPGKTDAQGIGAATTYMRRYLAAAMCGIAQEDDDGHAASHTKPPVPRSGPQRIVGPTLEDVRGTAKAAIDRVGRSLVMETLSAIGYERSDEIPEDQRARVIAALGALQPLEEAA
jgi:hypothetical protein